MVKKFLALAFLLVACSSPTTAVIPPSGDASDPPAYTTPEQPPSGIGGAEVGTDAGSDAMPDAPAPTTCGDDDAGVSLDQVSIEGPCDPSECAVPGAYHYVSPSAASEPGNDRPPIPGCKRIAMIPGGPSEFCCPPACLRFPGVDSDCANRTSAGPGATGYSCPGTLSPGASCLAYQTGGYATTYCCPN